MAEPITKSSDAALANKPAASGAQKRLPIGGMPEDYKVVRNIRKEFDVLGREVIEDGQPITDASKQVHRSQAKLQGRYTDETRKDPLVSGPPVYDRNGKRVVPDDFVGQILSQGNDGPMSSGPKIGQKGSPPKIGQKGTPPKIGGGTNGGKVTTQYGGKFGQSFNPNTMVKASEAKWNPDQELRGLSARDVATDILPRYFDGDEYGPAGEEPAAIEARLRKMVDAGLLPKSYKIRGFWDATAREAWKTLLGYANQSGISDEEMLTRWKEYGVGTEGVPGKALTIQNPKKLEQIFQEVAGRAINRSLTAGELKVMIDNYQKLDAQAQTEAFDATAGAQAGANTSAVEGLDAATFATDEIQEEFEGEAKYVTGNQHLQNFFNILGEGGGMSMGVSS